MQGYVIDHNRLRPAELPDPGDPGPGEALVRVRSVSLNYRDLMVARGRYGRPFEGTFVAGSDMAGEVLNTGPDVEDIRSGDRVINAPFLRWPAGRLTLDRMKTLVGAGGVDGVLCEKVRYPADALVRMPAHFSYDEGATLPIAGLTAWASVISRGDLRAGEWVLLHGTGGVSVFAAQLAKITGARTLVTTSSKEKGARMREEYGALETFDYRDRGLARAGPRLHRRDRCRPGRGRGRRPDVRGFPQSLRAARPGIPRGHPGRIRNTSQSLRYHRQADPDTRDLHIFHRRSARPGQGL